MVHRNAEPLARVRLEWWRYESEIGRPRSVRWLDQAPTGIAAAQRTADLSLVVVDRLHGVPARHPEARDERRGRLSLVAFHREGERGVRIVGGLRLVHRDVGVHGGASAVAMRFTRDFQA